MGLTFVKWDKKMSTLYTLHKSENNPRDGHCVRNTVNATDTTFMKTLQDVYMPKLSRTNSSSTGIPTNLSAHGGRIREGKKEYYQKTNFVAKKRKNTRGIWKYLRNVGLKTQFHGRKENHNRLL